MKEMKVAPKRDGSKVVFLCRLSFCHLDAPWAGKDGKSEPKYSVSCIVPKGDEATVKALREAVKEAYEKGVAKTWKGTRPNTKSSSFRLPLKDGDDERPDDEAYTSSIFFTASSKDEVTVWNRLRDRIPGGEAYSGCWAVVSVNFFAYATGSNGIGAGLNGVMKYADGDRLGGNGGGDVSDFDGMGLEPEDDIEDM